MHWIYKLGDEEPTSLSVDEDIGEQFVTISINRSGLCSGRAGVCSSLGVSPGVTIPPCCRILQYGHMSVIVERQRVHEIKGDSVAKGEQGLLNLDPHNVVFYVGGYPSSFTVRQQPGGGSGFGEVSAMPLEGLTGGKSCLTGGFHSQPPPALRYPNYRGCLELDTLNEEVVSLYNFQHTFELDTAAEKPCARWAPRPALPRGTLPELCLLQEWQTAWH